MHCIKYEINRINKYYVKTEIQVGFLLPTLMDNMLLCSDEMLPDDLSEALRALENILLEVGEKM